MVAGVMGRMPVHLNLRMEAPLSPCPCPLGQESLLMIFEVPNKFAGAYPLPFDFFYPYVIIVFFMEKVSPTIRTPVQGPGASPIYGGRVGID